MSLEHDIQQADFQSEYQKAMLNMIFTNYYLVDRMNGVFKVHDVTRQQYNVLRILRGQLPGHASVNLIKERMLDKMSDASRIVERLRIKGYVTREYCEKDKRSVEVKITETGMAVLDKMQGEVDGFEKLLYTLSEEETRELNRLLDKIRTQSKSGDANPLGKNRKSEEKITTLASL